MRALVSRRRLLVAAAALLSAAALPASVLAASGASQGKVAAEITQFRQQVLDAITNRDEPRLRQYYAEDYTHTHGSGGVDDRTVRIAAFMERRGGPIETLPAEELLIRVPGRDTAIVTGKSPFTQSDGKTRMVRWMIVYARGDGGWRTAASQATILP